MGNFTNVDIETILSELQENGILSLAPFCCQDRVTLPVRNGWRGPGHKIRFPDKPLHKTDPGTAVEILVVQSRQNGG